MLQVLHRFAFRFYNFSSILCLIWENQVYKVSNFLAICNFLKMPFSIIIAVLISVVIPLKDAIFKRDVAVLKDYSTLAKLSIVIAIFLTNIFSLIFCSIQVWRRYEITIFMNNILAETIREKYLAKFRKHCARDLIALFIVFISNGAIQSFGLLQLSVLSFFIGPIILYSLIVTFAFISFIKNFENYILASLRDLKRDLKDQLPSISLQHYTKIVKFCEFSKKYQNIYNLVAEFNECFGLQLTFFICYLTSFVLFTVCFKSVVKEYHQYIGFSVFLLVLQWHSSSIEI